LKEPVPATRTTEPVGVGLPLVALTVTATLSCCAVVMLDGIGTTVTVGVVFVTGFTVTGFDPVALLYIEELLESGV
jgi:hypothetical protein